MATLEQVGELVTTQLRERVDELVAAVEDDATDFAEAARRADEVGELADTIGAMYIDLEQRLARGLQRPDASEREGGAGNRQRQQAERPRGQGQQRSEQDESNADDVTKEELLEQARDLNVEGRSTMSKDELADAVEAEQSVTKEELLERAREAGIEGRSSMTKDELRKALTDAA
jgi:hypothetical protein